MIDIIKTSASRPELLKKSIESMLCYLSYDGELRWLMHEDFLNKEASEECVRIAENFGIFHMIL